VMNLKRNLLVLDPTNQQLNMYIDRSEAKRCCYMGKVGEKLTWYIRLTAARIDGCSIGCTCIRVYHLAHVARREKGTYLDTVCGRGRKSRQCGSSCACRSGFVAVWRSRKEGRKEGHTAARVDETRWNAPFRQDQSSYTSAQRIFYGGPQSAT